MFFSINNKLSIFLIVLLTSKTFLQSMEKPSKKPNITIDIKDDDEIFSPKTPTTPYTPSTPLTPSKQERYSLGMEKATTSISSNKLPKIDEDDYLKIYYEMAQDISSLIISILEEFHIPFQSYINRNIYFHNRISNNGGIALICSHGRPQDLLTPLGRLPICNTNFDGREDLGARAMEKIINTLGLKFVQIGYFTSESIRTELYIITKFTDSIKINPARVPRSFYAPFIPGEKIYTLDENENVIQCDRNTTIDMLIPIDRLEEIWQGVKPEAREA